MAAIARIDYGLAEGEFWRLTPRQFHEYGKRHAEAERRAWVPFRFLATATARAFGVDVDYMAEPEEEQEATPDTLEAWLQAKAIETSSTGGRREEAVITQPTGDETAAQLLNDGEGAD